jgi:Flp pilus assembly protein TadG
MRHMKHSTQHFKCHRRITGTNVIEFGCVAIALAVVAVLSADIGVVMLADSTNERACRDGARAAAQGSDSVTALKLAQAAVNTHAPNNLFVSNPIIDTSNFVYQDYAGNPPPNTSPYVSVVTSINVHVPAPVFFYGAVFNPSNGLMTLRKEYTFPIVKTQLYLN